MEIKDEKIKVQKYKGFSIGNLFKNFNKNGIAFPNVIKLKITLKIKPPTIIKNPAKIDSNKIITEKGFMSTTTNIKTANEWGDFSGSSMPIVMKIKPKKETKGIDLTKHKMGQDEILLSRNQTYSINKIYGENGIIYIDIILK